MPSNAAPVEGYAGGFVRLDRRRDMAAFDLLPGPVRRALDNAPFPISAVAALERYREKGLEYVLDEIAGDSEDWLRAREAEKCRP